MCTEGVLGVTRVRLNLGIWSCRGGLRQGALPSGVAEAREEQSPLRKGSQSLEGDWASPGSLAPWCPVSLGIWAGTSPVMRSHRTGTDVQKLPAPRPPAGEGSPFSHRAVGAARPQGQRQAGAGEGAWVGWELNGP